MTDSCSFRVHLGNDDSLIGKFFVDLEKQLTQISVDDVDVTNCEGIIEGAFVFLKSELSVVSSLSWDVSSSDSRLRWAL